MGALMGAVAHGLQPTSVTRPERSETASTTHRYFLGNRRTEK